MRLYEIRDWLKTLNVADNYYIGKLDAKKEKSVGVYDRNDKTPESMTIGGYENKKSYTFNVSILLHWTESFMETECAGMELVKKLRQKVGGGFYIGEHYINYVVIETEGAVDVDKDDNGIYERVVWLEFTYTD